MENTASWSAAPSSPAASAEAGGRHRTEGPVVRGGVCVGICCASEKVANGLVLPDRDEATRGWPCVDTEVGGSVCDSSELLTSCHTRDTMSFCHTNVSFKNVV